MKNNFSITRNHLIILFILLSFPVSAQMWQVKGELFGINNGNTFGNLSRMSGDGNTVIIGSGGANSGDGLSQVFTWNGTDWVQKGDNLIGDNNGLEGRAVDINFDGSIIVTAAYAYNTPTLNGAGRVQVYEWNGNQWTQMGASLFGETEWAWFGAAVSISNDGHTIAISETGYSSQSTNSNGKVHIYSWNGTNWMEMNGSPITGVPGTVHFGIDQSLGHDGTSLIIGDDSFDIQGSIVGLAQIFHYDGQTWSQKGDNLINTGVGNGGSFGYSVSISSDGNTIIVGAKDVAYGNGSGDVKTYKWNGTSWDEVGVTLYNISLTQFGYDLALNDAGSAMIVSSRGNYGKVYIYHWSGSEWIQIGQQVQSPSFQDAFGIAVDISSSGYSFIVGASSNDQNGANSGMSTIFEADNLSVAPKTPNNNEEIYQITDIMGRETAIQPNNLLIYRYVDGTHKMIYQVE